MSKAKRILHEGIYKLRNTSYKLTESDIRWAMASTLNNSDAARFLRITLDSYRKYAKMYYDKETGKNLYDLHKRQGGPGGRKFRIQKTGKTSSAEDIFEGKHPTLPDKLIKERLIEQGVFPDACMRCGFHTIRKVDYKPATVLAFKDRNKRNHAKENMEIVCFNCYFLHYGNLYKKYR